MLFNMNTEPTICTEPTVPTKPTVKTVMQNLEQTVNPKSIEEGLQQLANSIQNNDPSQLLEPMRVGAREFEENVGRPMSYSEMRQMWG